MGELWLMRRKKLNKTSWAMFPVTHSASENSSKTPNVSPCFSFCHLIILSPWNFLLDAANLVAKTGHYSQGHRCVFQSIANAQFRLHWPFRRHLRLGTIFSLDVSN